MKFTRILIVLSLLICGQMKMYGQNSQLPEKEIEEIKKEIIRLAEKQEDDLNKLNYEEIMTFYGDIDGFIMFGDGYYWGDYYTIDQIWKTFTQEVKENTWEFSNPKIYVFTKNAASLLVEFDHDRIKHSGEKKWWTWMFFIWNAENKWRLESGYHARHS